VRRFEAASEANCRQVNAYNQHNLFTARFARLAYVAVCFDFMANFVIVTVECLEEYVRAKRAPIPIREASIHSLVHRPDGMHYESVRRTGKRHNTPSVL